ncbi:uncharacterized protein PHACADRAFT_176509 [Phanerochaete carnosa HHB-10118-sp]|uniref:Cupin type-2 domain-containing protein n=1 Tax=Phanerochaete carnosa (strain HHB-10118-sp) TaxID=650164 RepID=K5W0S7_PHACS|nr:uncharacterized protein PHACADRAFT_176509 [Phanerochaete carnosa HHB-10118-sp]EKM52479.1 hypothetical protein PHACADRAFT_176509 [Phanerochaete carnosa HHB-10118-sp]
MSTTAPPQPPPARRVITGHTPDGKAIFVKDEPVRFWPAQGTTTMLSDAYRSFGFPISNDGGLEDVLKPRDDEIVNSNGSVFRIMDMPPHTETVLHRTLTIDYGIHVQGALTLVLDDNKRTVLKPGDVVVQRGTIHAWVNASDEWTRTYFVLLTANKVKPGEKELEIEFTPMPDDWKVTTA